MPATEFERRKEALINDIRSKITEGKELDMLLNRFDKIMNRKAAKARKALRANSMVTQPFYSKTRIPTITSLQSTKNITNEEALQELRRTIESWK